MDITGKRRKELYGLLGELPELSTHVSWQLIKESQCKHFILEELLLDLNTLEKVPAYFIRPNDSAKKPEKQYPVILYNHSHGGNYKLGKDELLNGNTYLQKPAYAEELARNGFSALCIDSWAFGKRSKSTESEIFKLMLWKGQVMWGMMVYDSLRTVDYLLSRQDIDKERIGTLGLSMGSTMAWWVAALDKRIKVCVDICCLTDFQSLLNSKGLDLHGLYYYVPGLLKHFSTSQINSLICPRPHLSLAGKYDPLTPSEGLKKIDKELKQKYEQNNAGDAWVLKVYDTGHCETADMREEIISFLKKWL